MKVYISSKDYNKKPSLSEVKILSKSITKNLVDISLQEFAEELTINGKTVVLAELSEKSLLKSTPIISQELIMLDFDNKDLNNLYTIEDLEQDTFMLENACFIYRTFSDENSKVDKFRVVFRLKEIITLNSEIENIYQELFRKYPQADSSVGQTSRLFFGSNSGYEVIDWDNRLNIQEVFTVKNTDVKIPEFDGVELLDLHTPVYKLLKYGRYDLVKQKWGDLYAQEFPDDYSAMTYFKSIDMIEILELPTENPFHDIMHEEENPSASVFYSDEYNVFFYKCFSDGSQFTGDIARLLAYYLELESKIDSIDLLLELTGSSINYSSSLGKVKKQANAFRKELISGELNNTNPELYNYLKRYSLEINATLDFMYDYAYIDKQTNNIRYLSYFSIETLQKVVGRATKQKISQTKMWNILNTIIITELVDKLPYNEIPSDIYERIIEPQIEDSKQIRTSNVYEPNQFSEENIRQMNEYAKILRANNTTVSSLSFELVYRLFGEEKAKRSFPQAYKPLESKGLVKMSSRDTNLTSKSIALEKSAVKIINKALEDKGYIYESELVYKLAKNRKSKVSTIKPQYQKIRTDIISNYDLNRTKLTKELYSKLKITDKYSPKIIIFR